MSGKSNSGDTLIVVYPASAPTINTDTITISVNNLPWSIGKAMRYELTESSFTNQILFNKTDSVIVNNNSFHQTHFYSGNQNSGRLIIWELIKNITSGLESISDKPEINIYPNPANGFVYIEGKNLSDISDVLIYDLFGRLIYKTTIDKVTNPMKIPIENSGMFIIRVENNTQKLTRKFINRH